MSEKEDFEPILEQMRRDWNERATQDAQQYVYTRDVATDESDFEASRPGQLRSTGAAVSSRSALRAFPQKLPRSGDRLWLGPDHASLRGKFSGGAWSRRFRRDD